MVLNARRSERIGTMSKTRRYFAAMCAAVLALVPTFAFFFVLNWLAGGGTLPFVLVTYVVGLAIFGSTTAALYGWAVDDRRAPRARALRS
jgi:predicted benzoate:H+ symporter BenE